MGNETMATSILRGEKDISVQGSRRRLALGSLTPRRRLGSRL